MEHFQSGQEFKVTRFIMRKWLDTLGMKRRKKRDAPYSNEKQQKKQQVILNKISRDQFAAAINGTDVIMDDETYIDMNGYDFAGNDSYISSGHESVPDSVKFKAKTKFPAKVLMWVAISRKGHSKAYFCGDRQQQRSSGTGAAAEQQQKQRGKAGQTGLNKEVRQEMRKKHIRREGEKERKRREKCVCVCVSLRVNK